jgi:beta-mannanase
VIASLDTHGPSYASIAAGNEDSTILAFLRSVNQASIKHRLGSIYITFEHEPDAHNARYLGTPGQFVQAWDHVHALAESAHLDWNDGGRLHWIFILIHNSWGSWKADAYWPGAGEADIVATDGYNSAGCRGKGQPEWTPDTLFDPLLSFAAAHRMPAFITEWGSDTVPAGIQPQFIQEMQAWVAAHKRVAAALYWDSGKGACDYHVNGQPQSIADLAAMGQAPALQGHISR